LISSLALRPLLVVVVGARRDAKLLLKAAVESAVQLQEVPVAEPAAIEPLVVVADASSLTLVNLLDQFA
jgi:hypothetical protein